MPARKPEQPHSKTREYYRLWYQNNKERVRGYYEKHREKKAEYHRKHYLRNKEKYLEQARQRRQQPGYEEYLRPFRRKNLLQRYGITEEDYSRMLIEQDHKCAICKSENTGKWKTAFFDIDHNHTTGKVRGLLCRDCNVTVGVIEKKQEKIALIETYLERHNDQRRGI